MKTIELTQGQFAKVDDDLYDYLMQWKWYAHCVRGGNYYVRRSARKGEIFKYLRDVYMHRAVLAYRKFGPGFTVEQYDSFEQCDHIFHDTLDNRSSKLCECTNRENQCNLKKYGSSRYSGVNWNQNRWVVQVKPCCNFAYCHIGRFTDEHEVGRVATAVRKFVVDNHITECEPVKQWARDHGYRK